MFIVHAYVWFKMGVAELGILVTVQQTQLGPPGSVTNQTKKQVSLEVCNIL